MSRVLCETWGFLGTEYKSPTSRKNREKWGTQSTVLRTLSAYRLRLPRHQPPQHILQNPTVGVVQRLLRRIDAHQRIELDCAFVFPCTDGADFDLAPGGELFDYPANAGDLKRFFSGQLERVGVLP